MSERLENLFRGNQASRAKQIVFHAVSSVGGPVENAEHANVLVCFTEATCDQNVSVDDILLCGRIVRMA